MQMSPQLYLQDCYKGLSTFVDKNKENEEEEEEERKFLTNRSVSPNATTAIFRSSFTAKCILLLSSAACWPVADIFLQAILQHFNRKQPNSAGWFVHDVQLKYIQKFTSPFIPSPIPLSSPVFSPEGTFPTNMQYSTESTKVSDIRTTDSARRT